MQKTPKRKAIVIPTLAEDRAITAAAKSDRDAQPLTARQFRAMVPMRSLRGRPKATKTKQLVSIRYSPEVLAYFRATGEGWQSLIDRVLREYVSRHQPESSKSKA